MSAGLIPVSLLVASERFGPRLGAEQVARALARGLSAGGRPDVVPWPLGEAAGRAFEQQLLCSRAVVIAAARLDERTLAGSGAFDVATRARQGGVPAYAVTARDAFDAFDARMLDLQLVLVAREERALEAAGRRLAEVV